MFMSGVFYFESPLHRDHEKRETFRIIRYPDNIVIKFLKINN